MPRQLYLNEVLIAGRWELGSIRATSAEAEADIRIHRLNEQGPTRVRPLPEHLKINVGPLPVPFTQTCL
jgi:hypothetical protein